MISFEVDDLQNMNERLSEFIGFLEASGVDDDAVFDSRLISCELITNVLRHCGCTARFKGALCDGEIIITVSAASPVGKITIPSLPCALAEGGRGLYIVNVLSHGNVVIAGGDVTVKLIVSK